MGIYEELKKAGVPTGHNESDLHAKVTPESAAIVAGYEHMAMVSRFTSQIDGEPWYDIPFAYQPFWDAKARSEASFESAKLALKKVAWIRDPEVPEGQSARGKLSCPCGKAPWSNYKKGEPDVLCACGRVFTWDGWIKWK